MCLLDYDFMVLNNAFLVHRPGIKTKKSPHSLGDRNVVLKQTSFITKILIPYLRKKHGPRRNCMLG